MPLVQIASMVLIDPIQGALKMFTKISLVSIPVKDQSTSKSFYVNILGCKIVQEMPFG